LLLVDGEQLDLGASMAAVPDGKGHAHPAPLGRPPVESEIDAGEPGIGLRPELAERQLIVDELPYLARADGYWPLSASGA
jgi:hypothetical protein